MSKRLHQGNATRDRLLDVATKLFVERGYDDTPVPAVLEAAGVSRGALYHHFESKEELFAAVLERVESDLVEQVRAAAGPEDDPLAQLHAGCRVFLRRAANDPAVQRIMLLEAPRVLAWERWRAYDEQFGLGGLKGSLGRLAQQGRLEASLVDTLAHMLLAALDEAALVIAAAEHPRTALRQAQAAVDLLLDRLFPT